MDATIDEGPGYRRLRRRRMLLLIIVGLVIVAAAGGVLLATRIKSPAQQAADTRPPAATELSIRVTRQVITSTVLAQASVGPPTEISPASIGGAGAGAQPIVTKIFVRQGDTVHQGSLLLEVAGQPYFVLEGAVPAYRNLVPGDTGTDVSQLQDALESLGYAWDPTPSASTAREPRLPSQISTPRSVIRHRRLPPDPRRIGVPWCR